MLKVLSNHHKMTSGKFSQRDHLVKQIKTHIAWRGEESLTITTSLLQKQLPLTYAISSGVDSNHFILSYLDWNHEVRCKNIRILNVHGSWIFKNGTSQIFDKIDNLIPHCLKSSPSVLSPLKAK